MSVRTALAALIGGVVLLLGSCAPLGISAYRSFFAEPASATPLQVGISGGSGVVGVPPGKLARVAIKVDIETASVQEVETSGKTEYKPRYRFPLSYTVTESRGRVLLSQEETVAWNEGSRATSKENASSTGATLTVSHSFDKFAVPATGAIEVEARLDADGTYSARVRKLELLVYGGLENEAPYVVAGIAMLFAGFVLAIVGLIFTLTAVASRSEAPAAGAPAAVRVPADMSVGAKVPGEEARRRAVICHLSGFAGYLLPFASVIAPLVLWMLWRDSDEFVHEQGREALNFQISVLIYAVASLVLIVLLVGILLIFAVAVFQLVLMVMAAVTADKGQHYRYPLTLRFIR